MTSAPSPSRLARLLPFLLGALSACISDGGLDRDCGERCDQLIEPDQETMLYIVNEPVVRYSLVADVGGEDLLELDTQEAEALREREEPWLERFALNDIDVWRHSELALNFDAIAVGPLAEQPEAATHRLLVQVTQEQHVNSAALPEIVFLSESNAEATLSVSRVDGGSAPLRVTATATSSQSALDLVHTKLVKELKSLPIFQWKSAGHMGILRAGAIGEDPDRARLSNPEALYDADPQTMATLEVDYARIIDAFLGLFGGDYEFDPTYLWLEFEEPAPLHYVQLSFAKNRPGSRVALMVSNKENPGPPAADSDSWVHAGDLTSSGFGYDHYGLHRYLRNGQPTINPGLNQLDQRLDYEFRHVAALFIPRTTDDDGQQQLEIGTFDLFMPPDRAWNDWSPPFSGGGAGGGCFTAGTDIATPGGPVDIENISVGDEVVTFDTERGEVVYGQVTRTFAHKSRPNGKVTLSDGRSVQATPNHPFFRQRIQSVVAAEYAEETSELEVVDAEELRPGDVVYILDTESDALEALTVSDTSFDAEPATVYNFTVEGTHSYFAEGILVHNK